MLNIIFVAPIIPKIGVIQSFVIGIEAAAAKIAAASATIPKRKVFQLIIVPFLNPIAIKMAI